MAKQDVIIGKWDAGRFQVVFDAPIEREKLAALDNGSVLEIKPWRTPSHDQYRLCQWILMTASEATGMPLEELKNRAKLAGNYVDGPAIQVGEHLCQPLKSTSAMSRAELSRFIEDLLDFCAVELEINVSAMRKKVEAKSKQRRR